MEVGRLVRITALGGYYHKDVGGIDQRSSDEGGKK